MGQKSYGKLQNPGRVCFMHNNETHIYLTGSKDPTDLHLHTISETHYFLPDAQIGCYVKDYRFSFDYSITVYILTSEYVAANYNNMTEILLSDTSFDKIILFYKTKSMTMNMRSVVKELKRIEKERQKELEKEHRGTVIFPRRRRD